VRLDLQKGTIGAVRLGGSAADIKAEFGPGEVIDPEAPALNDPEKFDTGGEDEYGPFGVTWTAPGAPVRFHRYPDKDFTLVNGKIISIEATGSGAVTAEGVRIGDSLDDVRTVYPDMECFTQNEDTEYREYPACLGHAGSRYNVWFGGDPIRNITLATATLD